MDKHLNILTQLLADYWDTHTNSKIIPSWKLSNNVEQRAIFKWYIIRLLKDETNG